MQNGQKISGALPSEPPPRLCHEPIMVKGLTKMSILSLRIVAGILVGPRAFRLFNWNISFHTLSWVTGLSTNEFNEELFRKFLKFFLD